LFPYIIFVQTKKDVTGEGDRRGGGVLRKCMSHVKETYDLCKRDLPHVKKRTSHEILFFADVILFLKTKIDVTGGCD